MKIKCKFKENKIKLQSKFEKETYVFWYKKALIKFKSDEMSEVYAKNVIEYIRDLDKKEFLLPL